MTKSFFIVVPYNPAGLTAESVGGIFGKKKKEEEKAKEASAQFEENRSQLEQRIAVIEQGLIRTGVRIVQLGTEEIIELYYKIFNPGEQDKPIKLNA
jgi:ABC-type Fe3+-hydroxamate transport system substrate-binding protein